MTFVLSRSQVQAFGDFDAAVLAFAATLKLWHDFAQQMQDPAKAVEILILIGNLRNAADFYIQSSIGPAPNFEPDYEIIDDHHVAEMCAYTATGAMLN
jgi:hypothetical protein